MAEEDDDSIIDSGVGSELNAAQPNATPAAVNVEKANDLDDSEEQYNALGDLNSASEYEF